jgi:hypothetical protein
VSQTVSDRQTFGKTLAQFWGIAFLALLFGMGAYRLMHKAYLLTWGGIESSPGEPPIYPGVPLTWWEYLLFAVIILLGIGKSWAIFHRKMVPRTLARARMALGETGWKGDYLLAPFCMLSLYRPWQRKHAIFSWILIPVMVALAVCFIVVVPNGPFKAAVDWAVGLALAYAAFLYVVALLRLLAWVILSRNAEKHPLPTTAS